MSSDVIVVLGTRPEAIKLHGLMQRLGPAARLVHTGQHYDASMWDNVLADLPDARISHHIQVGGISRGEQIGRATEMLTRHLIEHPGRAVVVQGDTNSTLAGALAANAVQIPVVHVEAGLRSHDRTMPEEINRLVVDTVADLCCAPTEENARQLRREGVADARIRITGNTLAEAVNALAPSPRESARIRAQLGVPEGPYVLVTAHRAANVDDSNRLRVLLDGLRELARQVSVVFPVHPRTAARIRRMGSGDAAPLRLMEPLSPAQFLALEARAALILSDSGGVQGEACILRRPLLVLRDSTERPELVAGGWCELLGDREPGPAMLDAWQRAPRWAAGLASAVSPYGDDDASAAIAREIDARWPSPSLSRLALT